MRCGNCREEHPSPADIRNCYAARYAAEGRLTERFSARLAPSTPMARETARRDEDAEWAASIRGSRPARPASPRPSESHAGSARERAVAFFSKWNMPGGLYAVPSRTGNNDLDFYRVDRPTTGNWVGYLFVKRVIGGQPARRISKGEQMGALDRITHFGPAKAAKLYSDETGECSKCRLHLTDDASRALGYGETCARNRGLGEEWKRLDRMFQEQRKAKAS